MILPDANILLYAQDSQSAFHSIAKEWLDDVLSGETPVCLCWDVLNAFMRIATNKRIFRRPLTMKEAMLCVQSWLEQPNVRLIGPTESHWKLQSQLMQKGQAIANLIPDAHLAALAIENGCVLYSADADFSRFPGLKWKNPLR